MYNIFSKYNSLDAVSQKQVRDLIDRLSAKMKGTKETHPLTAMWSVQDGVLLSRWLSK
jgi:hypothetical protein